MNESLDIPNIVTLPCGEHICDPDVGLYLHIPFCAKRCHFCAFYLVIQRKSRIQRFLGALETEIAIYAAQLGGAGQRVSTVYLGGGTPTAFDRVLSTRFGIEAIDAVHDGDFGSMVALRGDQIVRVPLAEAVGELKTVDLDLYHKVAGAFFG